MFNLLADEAETSSSVVDWSALLNTVWGWLASTGIKIVIALVIMIISFKVINAITKRWYKRLQAKKADETLSRVGTQTVRWVLKILITICLVGYLGIETASITAVVATLGLGVSMAVQGTLSNFAGGIIIIIMRPFKIGDFITSSGESGTVEDIKLFYTTIVTTDNRAVVIPNGTLANGVIVNASAKDTRRCDITVSASYGSDIDEVKKVIAEVCASNELIFKDPAPFIQLSNMNDSSLDFVVRVWCNRPDYWTVNFYLLDAIKKAFDANGIEIPFNQLDVNIKGKPQLDVKVDTQSQDK